MFDASIVICDMDFGSCWLDGLTGVVPYLFSSPLRAARAAISGLGHYPIFAPMALQSQENGLGRLVSACFPPVLVL
jgi:hypothetical protein